MKLNKNKRFIALNTNNGSVHILVARGYWSAFKQAQQWFGNQTGIKVWQDKMSTC